MPSRVSFAFEDNQDTGHDDVDQSLDADDDYSQLDPRESVARRARKATDDAASEASPAVSSAYAWLHRMAGQSSAAAPITSVAPLADPLRLGASTTSPSPKTGASTPPSRANGATTKKSANNGATTTSPSGEKPRRQRDTKPKEGAGHLNLRNVPNTTLDVLRALAKESGVSLTAFAIEVLGEFVAERR
jgi:hypothetical protein